MIMKKFMALLLVVVMVFSMIGCNNEVESTNPTVSENDTTVPSDSIEDTPAPSEAETNPSEEATNPVEDNTEPSQENPTNPSDETEPHSPKEDKEPTKPPKGDPDPTKPTNPPETTPEPTEKPADYTLKLSTSSVSMEVGESKSVTVTYTGSGKLTWSSSNAGVAKVSNGKITGVAAGTAYVTVSDGTKNATVSVTVKAKPAETQPPTTPPADYTLKLSTSSVSMEVGESKNVTVTYTGSGTLTWKSSNTGVAKVSSGKITGVAAGTAYVTVSDGMKNATVSVTVKAKPAETQPPETQPTTPAAELKILTTKAEVTAGNTYQVEYSYTGNKSNLIWTSNDTSVATVNGSGVVTAISAGQALIKVTDGTTTKRCTITVVAPPTVYATSIEFRGESGNMYDGVTKTVGDSYSARLVVKPNEANQDVYVSSSNSSVVSVSYSNDSDYTRVSMSFNSAGTATVTFTSGDGAVSMSYTITVKDKEPVSSGELSPEAFASAIEQTLVANGFTIDRTCSGWTQATYSASELTSSRAVSAGNNLANQWWEIGHRYCNIQYAGQNANGDYVFHFGSG